MASMMDGGVLYVLALITLFYSTIVIPCFILAYFILVLFLIKWLSEMHPAGKLLFFCLPL